MTHVESVEQFAARARAWLADNMPRLDPDIPPRADRGDEDSWQRARELQQIVHAGGFAGICFPARIRWPRPRRRLPEGLRCRDRRLRAAPDPQRPHVHHLLRHPARRRHRRPETATHFRGVARGTGAGSTALRAQRRIRSGRPDHPRRARRQGWIINGRQDMEHQRLRRRLRAAARPDRPDGAETRWPDHVHDADSRRPV